MPRKSSSPDVLKTLQLLERKYAASGQDLGAYLDGLLQTDYLTYWDYAHLDTLLSLQKPRTTYPDELIFITYHQVTELYFKLILHEINQIADRLDLTVDFFESRISRLNRYFDLLEKSFTVLIEGMEKEQFLKFRTALMSSSGFQSVQFRQIEIASTDFANLLATNHPLGPDASMADQYEWLYWKQGATDIETHKKTLTLRQFEKQYGAELTRLAEAARTRNLWQCYQRLKASDEDREGLITQLRDYDWRVNVRWKMAHLRSAVTFLSKEDQAKATGGTNWRTYLPPIQQHRLFFPTLWSETERQQWGRFRFGE